MWPHHLLPLAWVVATVQGAPLWLVIHGVDAWAPHASRLVRRALHYVDTFVAVSEHTKRRFLAWAPLDAGRGYVIPNCVDTAPYGPGPKREDLLTRYGLHNRTVLCTLGRLSSMERYKGTTR